MKADNPPYNVKLVDKLSAMMLIMFACSEVFMSEIEKEMVKARYSMRHEPKMLIGDLLRHAKSMHTIYDRLCEISVDCATSEDDNVVDAFLGDKNLFVRFFMMAENAMHGAEDNTRMLQLESTLKLLAKDPVFEQNYIDKLTNFK